MPEKKVAHFLPVLVKPKPHQVDTETTETKSSKNQQQWQLTVLDIECQCLSLGMFVPLLRRVAFGLPTATRNTLLSTTCKKFNTVDASKNIQPFVQEIHPEKAVRLKRSGRDF